MHTKDGARLKCRIFDNIKDLNTLAREGVASIKHTKDGARKVFRIFDIFYLAPLTSCIPKFGMFKVDDTQRFKHC